MQIFISSYIADSRNSGGTWRREAKNPFSCRTGGRLPRCRRLSHAKTATLSRKPRRSAHRLGTLAFQAVPNGPNLVGYRINCDVYPHYRLIAGNADLPYWARDGLANDNSEFRVRASNFYVAGGQSEVSCNRL